MHHRLKCAPLQHTALYTCVAVHVCTVQNMCALYRTCVHCTEHVCTVQNMCALVQNMCALYRTCVHCTEHVCTVQNMCALCNDIYYGSQLCKLGKLNGQAKKQTSGMDPEHFWRQSEEE